MNHGDKKKMGRKGAMGGMYARAKAGDGGMKNRSMYMKGGKVYSNIRDMEEAHKGPDYNESMRQK